MVDFLGKIDGEPFDGGTAEDFPLVLGSGQFIPGFEEQLVGAKTGEEKRRGQLPRGLRQRRTGREDRRVRDDRQGSQRPNPPRSTTSSRNASVPTTWTALKTRSASGWAEYAEAARRTDQAPLLDALDEKVEFDLPPSLVDSEAKQIAHQLWHEENPDVEGHDHPEVEPTEEHNSMAERRVRSA